MKAFISYSWDSEEHKDWVRNFADALRINGVDVTLDQYDLKFGTDRIEWMEKAIADADFVLVVCTPVYVEKANQREKGVGVETTLLSSRFFDRYPGKQLIPVIRRKGQEHAHTPDYLSSLYFADFRHDQCFDSDLEDLLRHVFNQPKFMKPPVGPVPSFGPAQTTWGKHDIRRATIDSSRHIFISHPFSSVNRERLTDIAISAAESQDVKLSFSHMPTEAVESKYRIIKIVGQAHGLISVWDDSRAPHAVFRPWRTFEFEAAEDAGIPTVLFCHERFRKLIATPTGHMVFYSSEHLESKFGECFGKLQGLIESTKAFGNPPN